MKTLVSSHDCVGGNWGGPSRLHQLPRVPSLELVGGLSWGPGTSTSTSGAFVGWPESWLRWNSHYWGPARMAF